MKALVIVCQPFFAFRGTSFSVYHRAKMMAKKGVEIDLLTYGEGKDVDLPGVNIIRIFKIPFLGPVKVGPSFKKAFLDVFIFFRMIALLSTKNYDIIHAHEESAFFCLILKKLFRFKWIYDMHSSLPEQLTNFKFTNSKLLIGLFKRLEKASLRQSDAVITICPELQKHALSLMFDPKKHFMIENSLFEMSDHNKKISISLPKNKKLIVYAGTFETYQGLDMLIEAFHLVTKEISGVVLLLIGAEKKQIALYQNLIENYQVSDCAHIYPRMDQAEVRQILRHASLQVSPRIKGNNTPLKIYEQLANGIPLVATNISSHTQILNDTVCFLVNADPKSFAQGLTDGLKNPVECMKKVSNAQNLYEQNYSPDIYKMKIDSLLHTLKCEKS